MWDWFNALGAKPESLEEDLKEKFLLTSDLSEATDHCNQTISRIILNGFLVGLNMNPKDPYLKLAIDLVTCNKLVIFV
jgi:hypothetical protein